MRHGYTKWQPLTMALPLSRWTSTWGSWTRATSSLLQSQQKCALPQDGCTCTLPWNNQASNGDKILYLNHYDLRDVRSRGVGTELAAPLTAKTSVVFPAGFVQQNNKYAVKKQNETNVSTDKTRNRWGTLAGWKPWRRWPCLLCCKYFLLPGRECFSGYSTNKWTGVAWGTGQLEHSP